MWARGPQTAVEKLSWAHREPRAMKPRVPSGPFPWSPSTRQPRVFIETSIDHPECGQLQLLPTSTEGVLWLLLRSMNVKDLQDRVSELWTLIHLLLDRR